MKLIRSRLFNGDIVYPCVGTIGNAAVIEEYDKYHIQQNIAKITPIKNLLDSYFLAHYLMSNFGLREIEKFNGTSSQPNILVGSLRQYSVILPNLTEQAAIATALSDTDALINALDKLIAKKRLIKQGAMQQLLSGKKRLAGFSGEWEVTDLFSVCSEMQNGVFFKPSNKGFGIKIINVSDLYKKTPIDESSLELFNANNSEKERFNVKDGDLFFTRSSVVPSGIAHCNIYQSNNDESVVFDSHVIRIRPNKNKVVSSFLFRFCLSLTARNYLISHAKTGTMTTIDQRVLAKCPVFLPTIEEQTAIAQILSDMDNEIAALEQRRAKTQQIKHGMMQELLTGKTRLI